MTFGNSAEQIVCNKYLHKEPSTLSYGHLITKRNSTTFETIRVGGKQRDAFF